MATENEIVGIQFTTDAKQATEDTKKLGDAIEETGGSVKSLRGQLKEAVANVATMADKFGATSVEAVNAAKKAAELKDKIGDAKVMTDAFNPDAKFKAVTQSLTGVAGGFAAVQGVMGLFGTESKDVEKALLKVNSAMALAQGLNALGDSIDSFKTLNVQIQASSTFQKLNATATSIAATAQKAFGVAVETTSTGFKVLKGAIIATGVGALVVLLGSVIANFDAIKKWIMSSPLGALAKGVGEVVEAFTDFIGVTSEAKRNLDSISKANTRANEDIANRIKVLKAQGGSEKEIYDLKIKQTDNELASLRNKLKVNGELTDEETKQFRTLQNDKTVAAAEYNKKATDDTAKANKEKKDAQNKHNEEIKKIDDDAKKKIEEDTKTANKTLLDLQNEKALAEITSEEDKAKKKLEIDKDAKLAEIDALKINDELKKKLRDAANEAYDADLIEVNKKQVEAKTKKDEEEAKTQKEFQTKISDIKIAAIKDDNEREEATRLAKLKKQLSDLDEDKEFIKLSQEEQAKIKKDLIDTSEAEGQKSKNEIIKKGLLDEVELLQAQQKGLTKDSGAYWDNVQAIEDKSYQAKLLAAKGNAKEIEKIEKEHSANNIAIETAEKEAKKAILLEKFKAVENFGKDLQTLAGKNRDLAIAGVIIEKAAAIGQVVVNTVAATAKAVNASPLTLGLPWSALIIAGGIAQTALIIKSGIDQINAIKDAGKNLPSGGSIGGGGGGSAPDLSGAGAGAVPNLGTGGAPNTGGGGGGNTGGGGGGGGGGTRVYVLESDISNTQDRVRTIENRASFN